MITEALDWKQDWVLKGGLVSGTRAGCGCEGCDLGLMYSVLRKPLWNELSAADFFLSTQS